MRVNVNEGSCVGHTMCHAAAPEVFGLDEDGYVELIAAGELPAGLDQAARLGVSSCPERALSLIDLHSSTRRSDSLT